MENNTINQVKQSKEKQPKSKKIWKITAISSISVAFVLAVLSISLLVANNQGSSESDSIASSNTSNDDKIDNDNSSSTISVPDDRIRHLELDLTPNALLSSQQNPNILTLDDVSDTFSRRHLNITEWGLKIQTRFADFLEYRYYTDVYGHRDSNSKWALCNGDYFRCDSVVVILIKEDFIDMEAERAKGSRGYTGDGIDEYKLELRTIGHIFRDNVRKSISREKKSRSFNGGTLLFEAGGLSGNDEHGRQRCSVSLTPNFRSNTPCEEMFMSLYTFNLE